MASTYIDKNTEEELAQLKALIAEQQERLDALEGRSDASTSGGASKEQKATRRQLLKLAGAAFAGAAGSAALRAIPASATFGDTVTVGTVFSNATPSATGVTNTTAVGTPNTALFGYSFNSGIGVFAKSYYGYAGFAYGVTYGATGVVALGGYNGVIATGGNSVAGSGNGVVGVGTGLLGTGVKAQTNSTSSRALYAYTSAASSLGAQIISTLSTGLTVTGGTDGTFSQGSQSGVIGFSYGGYTGVVGASYGGPDFKAFGTGRIVQVANISGGVGAPNFTPTVNYFEMVRAGDGGMWINRGGSATLKAAWKRLNAVRVDASDGTGVPFKPFRLVDTRSGTKPAKNSTKKFTAAGAGTGTSKIPSDAIAVIGNLTATQYSGGGFLSISPAGVAVTTSTVNFITGQAAIANSFIVGLGTGADLGKLQVHVSNNTACHYIIDITGYFQ